MKTSFLIIYFDKAGKCKQVVKPNHQYFDGNWKDLAATVAGGEFSHYEVV